MGRLEGTLVERVCCPWCDDETAASLIHDEERGLYQVVCSRCGRYGTSAEDADVAMEMWVNSGEDDELLLPCPNCHSRDLQIYYFVGHELRHIPSGWRVYCRKCHIMGPDDPTDYGAECEWNLLRRT